MSEGRFARVRDRVAAKIGGRRRERRDDGTRPTASDRVTDDLSVVVLGGGLAGIAAATVLAERGARVTLLEREPWLGGRLATWPIELPDGETLRMERGFHAFFRQYYNVRALMRRVDPDLARLVPLADYPVFGPGGAVESFEDLPTRPPLNVAAVVMRSRHLGLRDLASVDKSRAIEMLAFDPAGTYRRLDHLSAREYLDGLNFPPQARRMLFDVFAHSFFNPEETMSAGELLMMFHFYFTGNPEGLVFDVLDDTFSTALLEPLARYLEGLGVEIRTGTAAERASREADGSYLVATASGEELRSDGLVLALNVPGLKALFAKSPRLGDRAMSEAVASLDVTSPFIVWRLWLDRPTAPGRHPFVGTAGLGRLDNISLFHLIERESAAWAARTGGAVVELHAYGVAEPFDEADVRRELLGHLHALYPETRDARVIDERWLVERDCPSFAPGSHALRPEVDMGAPQLALCGDFVKLPFPSALMERAVASGFIAANHLLQSRGVRGQPIATIPRRGLLAAPLNALRSSGERASGARRGLLGRFARRILP